jgi:hypothetical protein
MSDRRAGATEAVVPFAPKPNAKPEASDPLDRAAQAVLGLLHRPLLMPRQITGKLSK